MKKPSIAHHRPTYRFAGLEDRELDPNPFTQFSHWLDNALRESPQRGNAMALATSSKRSVPAVRMVLLKKFDQRGFVFFSNSLSGKGKDIAENNKAAVLFHWTGEEERQVRIAGVARKTTRKETLSYFRERPRESQLAAWASAQSTPLSSRAELERKMHELRQKYENRPIPLPPHWSGYRLVPSTFEFWQGRANRLHDRFLYTRKGGRWMQVRLSP